MKRNNFTLTLFLFLFIQFFYAQVKVNESEFFNGKIVSETKFLDEVNIINVSKKIGVISHNGGYFTIEANVKDTLMFSAINLKGYQRMVTYVDLTKELVFIPMDVLVNQLSEITLTEYRDINAVSLGIIPKGQKSYTPAERRLSSAGGVGIIGLINLINGRRKMLKKELVVEKKEFLQEETIDYFTKEYIANTLKIPEEYIDGFLFYVVEDTRYSNIMKNDDKMMASFVLSELATEYLELKKIEITKKDEKK